jgi:hypothetical protein
MLACRYEYVYKWIMSLKVAESDYQDIGMARGEDG